MSLCGRVGAVVVVPWVAEGGAAGGAAMGATFCFQAEDGIRVVAVTGVQTCALPI